MNRPCLSGARTIPDALRLAPGVQVARIHTSQWAVGIRGFPSRLSRSLLVLIDGRSVYTPLFAGVYWESQDLFLDDIERIEVIRGPGGTLWGANAVNGVINIITKSADRAQGGRLSTHVGRYQPGNVDFSYGGSVGASGSYAAYGRYFQRTSPGLTQGYVHGDDIEAGYTRTRIDWATGDDSFSVQGDVQHSVGQHVESALSLSAPFRAAALADVLLDVGRKELHARPGELLQGFHRLRSLNHDNDQGLQSREIIPL